MDPEEEAMLANLIGRDMQQLKDRTSGMYRANKIS